jgi:hypothetical protein
MTRQAPLKLSLFRARRCPPAAGTPPLRLHWADRPVQSTGCSRKGIHWHVFPLPALEPAGAKCAAPPTVLVNNGTPTTFTVTVATSGSSSTLSEPGLPHMPFAARTAVLSALAFLVLCPAACGRALQSTRSMVGPRDGRSGRALHRNRLRRRSRRWRKLDATTGRGGHAVRHVHYRCHPNRDGRRFEQGARAEFGSLALTVN